MNDTCLDIAFLSLPERALATLQIYLQGAGREVFREVPEERAEIAIFDFDHPASRAHWQQFGKAYGKPGIVLSVAEQNSPDAVWVGKPFTAAALGDAAARLRSRLAAPGAQRAAGSGASCAAAHPIRVALLTLEARNEAALNMFFRGEGRNVFSLCAEEDAEVAIFDYDHPVSRAHWAQFNARSGRPGILFSVLEQTVADAVWVRKPVTGAGLLAAAAMLPGAAPGAAMPEAAAPPPETPVDSPADTAATAAKFAAPAPGPQQEVLPQSKPAIPARSAVPAPDERRKPTVLPWIGAGVGLALLAGLWFWMRPPGGPTPPSADNLASKPPLPADSSGAPPTDMLRSAVDTSVAEYRAKSASDQGFITAQMDELYKRGAGAIEDVKAKLDRLTADPKALAEYNQSVYNKVHLAPEGVSDKAGGNPAAERELRSRLESVVGTAIADPRGDAFVASIKPETRVREAETRTITVRKGDTLSAIAQRAYGDAAQFMKIFEANPRVLTSPDHIFPDQVLRVPLN